MVTRICKEHTIQILRLPYLSDLSRTRMRSLARRHNHQTQQVVREFEKLFAHNALIHGDHQPIGEIWTKGFQELFGATDDVPDGDWVTRMTEAVIQALNHAEAMRQESAGQAAFQVILITPLIKGRNQKTHQTAQCTLAEITRWALYVQPRGIPRRIHCVHHPRNLDIDWTIRYDWRLPARSDDGPYPFCVPEKWWELDTQAVRTIRSKPAWIDRFRNGWTRPNINQGSGYHWDVFIENHQLQEQIGLNHLNVVEYGAPRDQGVPGHVHHTATEKQPHLNQNRSWSCSDPCDPFADPGA